jgi:hypothetical protein
MLHLPGSRSLRVPCTAAVIVLWCLAPTRAQTPSTEYRLKAAFLYRLPSFVDWPAAAVTGRSSLDLCVERPDPFGSVLAELVAGEALNGLPYRVLIVGRDQSIDACHVLFVPAEAAGSVRAILQKTSSLPILTIGESPGFLEGGGIINLRIIGGRIRFDVSDEAARRAGLRLSSQLLKLANSVK